MAVIVIVNVIVDLTLQSYYIHFWHLGIVYFIVF